MIAITTLSELTLDGRLSWRGRSGEPSGAARGERLNAWFDAQRSAHQAIMVGANTVRSEDPDLSVRHAHGNTPLRIVPSSDGLLPLCARVLNDGLPTLVVVSRRADARVVAELSAKPQVEVLCCGELQVDLCGLLMLLARRGIRSLLVEGGARLLHSLFSAELVGRMIVRHLPVLCDVHDAPVFLQGLGGRAQSNLSLWAIEQWFVLDGVGISVHRPRCGSAA